MELINVTNNITGKDETDCYKGRGYYVDTVGKNKKTIEEYIRNQLQEDIASDQLSLFEPVDPFTWKKVPKK